MKNLSYIILAAAVIGLVVWYAVKRATPAAKAQTSTPIVKPEKDRVAEVKGWLTVPGAAADSIKSLKGIFGGAA